MLPYASSFVADASVLVSQKAPLGIAFASCRAASCWAKLSLLPVISQRLRIRIVLITTTLTNQATDQTQQSLGRESGLTLNL
ncbi:hypothetical protein ACLKA6_011239 [Drosophila palustris]